MLYHGVDRYFIVHIKLKILDLSDIEKYDSQKMYKFYDEWPQIARDSFESEQEPVDFQNIDHFVFAASKTVIISIPTFSNKIANSFTNAMLRSLNTLVVNLTAFAVLQFGIGIKSTVKTCL